MVEKKRNMATRNEPASFSSRKYSTIIVTFVLLIFLGQTTSDFPELQIVESHAKDIQRNLLRYLETNSGMDVLSLGYREVGDMYSHLNGTQLVLEMASKLDKMFNKKLSALKRLKEKAEDTVRDYKYDSMIKMCDVKYFNMKNPQKNETMEYGNRFQQEVNFSTSGVHIPLEIYEDPDILNGLKWSESLDTTFKQNIEENPDMAWQFFGSQNGFMRVYPANRWKDIQGIPDLYDVRRRPWYIQGSTSPKDMLILMDVSGSVHGQTFDIMKTAVKTLLNTLEENDYVNVAWFSNVAGWVTCFETFVQANSWNKKVLFEGIDDLKDGNMASYATALEFAFEEFHKFSENKTEYEGSECHKVIMFFTDGGTERPEEVLKKYNENKEIRIFSYAVGPHAVPVHTIKWLACKNRGYFNAIASMSAVRTKIQQYPSVLARPLALHENNAETYSTVYTDAGGLGMVITVTLPVFNRSEESRNQTVVGVVGIDTPVEDFEALMPTMKAGPNTYAFAINPNGFVILHPKMRAQHVYLEDAPDIDFLDLEEDDPSQEAYISVLRKDMIDERTGSHQFRTYVNTGDDYHTIQKNLTYYFAPIPNTTLSLGMAIAEDRKGYINVKSFNTYKGIDITSPDEGFLVAPWKYCEGINTTLTMSEFILRLSEEIKRNLTYCDKNLVRHLLWDIERTSKVQLIWKIKKPNADGKRISVFVGTEGGFTRFYPASEIATYMNVRDPFKSTYFKKALYYPTWTFLISDEFDSSVSGPFVTAVKPIVDEASKQRYKPAVFGVHLNESAVYELLSDKCEDMDSVVCYLLDDGGFIVSSNQPHRKSQLGKFLGEEDAMLMWNLNNKSVYRRRLEYDYHAVCTRIEPRISAGRASQIVPSITSLLQIAFHAIMDSIIWLLISGWTAAFAQGSGEVGVNVKAANYSCTKVRALYYFMPINENNGPSPVHDEMVCGNCTRFFAAVRLQQTNLLLVTAQDSECPISECMEVEQLKHKPSETNGPNVCQLTPRYRKRPKGCFANHDAEDASVCSATDTISISVPVTMAILISLVINKCIL